MLRRVTSVAGLPGLMSGLPVCGCREYRRSRERHGWIWVASVRARGRWTILLGHRSASRATGGRDMGGSHVDAHAGRCRATTASGLAPRLGAGERRRDDAGDSPGLDLCGRRRDQPGADHRDRPDALHRAGARDASAFAVGWALALAAVSGAAYAVADAGDAATETTASDSVSWAQIAFGAIFLLLAARAWRNRPSRASRRSCPPGWRGSRG